MSDSSGRLELVLRGRERAMGSSTVRRVLPVAQRRAVGPFVFLDHLGPETLAPGRGFDVGPHPHVGLSTVTYLFAGEGLHQDSLGSVQRILPGELNWMTAGRGIVHSERSTEPFRARGGELHGLQLWVALPREHEQGEPGFQHLDAEALCPVATPEGPAVRLLAGTAYGATAKARVHSPLFFVDAELEPGETLRLPEGHPQRAAYVVQGAVEAAGQRFEASTLLLFSEGAASLRAVTAARVALLGGAPLGEERHLRWNFVGSSRELLDEAERRWREGRFPRIPTDPAPLIPMPEYHFR